MRMMPPEILQQICDEHWQYVEEIIRNEYDSELANPSGTAFDLDAYCRRVGLHYKLAMAHGFKHGVQWIESLLKSKTFGK